MELKYQAKISCRLIGIVLLYPAFVEIEVLAIYLSNVNANLSIFMNDFLPRIIILILPSLLLVTITPKIIFWYINNLNKPNISPKGFIFMMVGFSLFTISVVKIIITLITFLYKLQGTHVMFRSNAFEFFYVNFIREIPELSFYFFNIIVSIFIIKISKK